MSLETNPFIKTQNILSGGPLTFGVSDIDLKIEELSKRWNIEINVAKRLCFVIDYGDITLGFYNEWKIIKQKCVEYMKTKYFHVHNCISMLGSNIVKCSKCFEKAHKSTTILTFLEFDLICEHLPNIGYKQKTNKVIQDRSNIGHIHDYLKRMEARDVERKKEDEIARLQNIHNELVAQLVESLDMKFSTDSELDSMVPVFNTSLIRKIREDYSELEHPGFYNRIMGQATRQADAKIARLKADIKQARLRSEELLQQDQAREIERLREIVRQKELENKALVDALDATKTVKMPDEISEDPC